MKTVYVGMAAEILHEGHINLLKNASELGSVTVGLLSDLAISQYKEKPAINYESRFKVISAVTFVKDVIAQDTLSYKDNLIKLQPDFVVHGDDWLSGPQVDTRTEVITTISKWGGKLVEIPYTLGISTSYIKGVIRDSGSSGRVSSLKKKLINQTEALRFIDLHSALSGLIAENTTVEVGGRTMEFDGMWASSLTDSTNRGKPDIEAVDVSARIAGLQDTLEVTKKPIIFDGDTGGRPEHFAFTVKTLERNGISAVIIEDKFGLKRNSLLDHAQPFLQEDIENFSYKISIGSSAKSNSDFMIIARIESLILGKPINDALERSKQYIRAGADAIMIHSRDKTGNDALEFVNKFKILWPDIPIIVVPTSFNKISYQDLWNSGVNIVIYANHLLRASYPAMIHTAKQILIDGKTEAIEDKILSMAEILSLIPGTNI
jgi:phosphoenolpyruvate phosphomutase